MTASYAIDSRPIVAPFSVAIDTREQLPYDFTGLSADAKHKNRPLSIPTQRTTLSAGDYSIVGMETRIAVERKSLADLYSTIGQGLERFRAEHERLATYDHAVVIIEASLDTVISHPPKQSRLDPKTIVRIANKWPIRYGVHWRFVGIDRQQAFAAIGQHGLETVAAWVGVAFFRQDSHEDRVTKVVEAYRAQYSRWLAQSITYRTLEAFHSLELDKEKERKRNERSIEHAHGTPRGERIGHHGRGRAVGATRSVQCRCASGEYCEYCIPF